LAFNNFWSGFRMEVKNFWYLWNRYFYYHNQQWHLHWNFIEYRWSFTSWKFLWKGIAMQFKHKNNKFFNKWQMLQCWICQKGQNWWPSWNFVEISSYKGKLAFRFMFYWPLKFLFIISGPSPWTAQNFHSSSISRNFHSTKRVENHPIGKSFTKAQTERSYGDKYTNEGQ